MHQIFYRVTFFSVINETSSHKLNNCKSCRFYYLYLSSFSRTFFAIWLQIKRHFTHEHEVSKASNRPDIRIIRVWFLFLIPNLWCFVFPFNWLIRVKHLRLLALCVCGWDQRWQQKGGSDRPYFFWVDVSIVDENRFGVDCSMDDVFGL